MTFDEVFEQRVEELRGSPAYQNYLQVRDHVATMKDSADKTEAGTGAPSAYWSEELENIEYLLDASPLVIEKLRHHCYHVTGVWPYNYRTHKDRTRLQHALKLQALLALGRPELFVPEPPDLGGFGFEAECGLYNIDTLKYYEVILALDRGAVLSPFLERGERRVVAEIGSGWGGFAYQFHRLARNTTYILVDLPELFLYSGTYLLSMFPDASSWFYGVDGSDASEVPWEDTDFVFIPNTGLQAFQPPRLDLVINMVSFQEMTTAQVEGYVTLAYELECPFLYSLNRERSLYNPELEGVSAIIERYYWPHVIEVLPVSYTRMSTDPAALRSGAKRKRASVDGGDLDYRHIVGWRRLR